MLLSVDNADLAIVLKRFEDEDKRTMTQLGKYRHCFGLQGPASSTWGWFWGFGG